MCPRRWVFSSCLARSNQVASLGGCRAAGHRLLSRVLNLVFPEDCSLCQKPLADFRRFPVCAECLATVEPLAAEYWCVSCRTPFVNASPLDASGRCPLCRDGLRAFDGAYSFGSYQDGLRRLIHMLKYDRVRPLAAPLARLALRALPRDLVFEAVVPVPMHWRRRWARGFNQAELIAGEIGGILHLPVRAAVKRTRWTPSQADLTTAARKRNVTGSFAVINKEAIQGRRILLVDDVMTTGATAGACAAVLKRAGARSVTVLTVARADRRIGLAVLRGIGPKKQSVGAGQ